MLTSLTSRSTWRLLALVALLSNVLQSVSAQRGSNADSTRTYPKLTILNHQRYMDELYGPPAMEIKTIGILVYEGMFTLDAVGPMCVLSELSGTDVRYIGLQKGLIRSGRTVIQVEQTIADVKSLDILIIPGGSAATWEAGQDSTLLQWIRKIDQTTQITASVCTGAWILGEAGLLQGRRATTHWYRAEEMLTRYGATYTPARYVHDGKYWTSAGVTAGMDMSLALILEIRGQAYLQGAMLDLEYDPHPPIDAGTPAKSDPAVVDMMVQMYDFGLQPLIEKTDRKKKRSK
jgi:putative intracellular protease/amidase